MWGEGNYTVASSSSSENIIIILASGGNWEGPNETTIFELTTSDNLILTDSPSPSPSSPSQTTTITKIQATTQVNIYLTGVVVPSNNNDNNNNNNQDNSMMMTTQQQQVFETLFYTILQSRLATVDVNITKVVVDTQIVDSLFDADSPFESQQNKLADDNNNNGVGGGAVGGESSLPVLQLLTNVTLTYSNPPPEGWRDWSIYLTSWIESFGPTMVDIFTDPKNDLYPNESFFNTISDVSAENVAPPNTDPTASPTMAPTYLGAPEYKQPLVAGLASTGVIVVVLFFTGALWYKRRRIMMTRTHNIPDKDKLDDSSLDDDDEEENSSSSSPSPDDVMLAPPLPSTPHRSNRGEMSHRRSNNSYQDGRRSSSENIETSRMMLLEETQPTPRQAAAALGVGAVPHDELQDAQYDEIVAAVTTNNPNYSQVILDNKRQIGNDGGEALWQALTTNKYVKLLSLQNSNITDEQMTALALALDGNTSISHLSLQNNNITSEGVEYLVVCLECNSTIKVVDLNGNSPIDPTIHNELKGILQSRGGGHAHGVFDNRNRIDLLLERIRSNDPNSTQLDLHGMSIGPNDNIDAIMDALAENSYLRKVDLSRNMIDDDCVSALSIALAENTSITHLFLADNRITSIGAEYILCALDNNDTIGNIDLAGNLIDAEVIAELNHALEERTSF